MSSELVGNKREKVITCTSEIKKEENIRERKDDGLTH